MKLESTRDIFEGQVKDKAYNKVRSQVRVQVWYKVRYQDKGQVNTGGWDQVDEQLLYIVWDQVIQEVKCESRKH